MNITDFIKQYTLPDILTIEQNEEQYRSLENARKTLISYNSQADQTQQSKLFLSLILQNALISYQVAWSWPDRWEEYSQKIIQAFPTLQDTKDTTQRWYDFITTSRYNKRLYNIKKKRIQTYNTRFNTVYDKQYNTYYKDLSQLTQDLAQAMNQTIHAKTITFAIKMFGYGLRIVWHPFTHYPHDVSIPVDSRLLQIYHKYEEKTQDTKKVQQYFNLLAQDYNIPPLHLDSLLWIVYRKNHM